MEALEALRTRRAIRQFEQRTVSQEDIETIVDCGRLAASAINIQPWEFVAVRDVETRRRIADATDHGKHIAHAPVCILVFCRRSTYYLEDGSAATQNIMVAARALGLGSCWVAGDKKTYAEEIRALVGVPGDFVLVSLIPIGYPAEKPNPEKRPLSQVLHWEKFER